VSAHRRVLLVGLFQQHLGAKIVGARHDIGTLEVERRGRVQVHQRLLHHLHAVLVVVVVLMLLIMLLHFARVNHVGLLVLVVPVHFLAARRVVVLQVRFRVQRQDVAPVELHVAVVAVGTPRLASND